MIFSANKVKESLPAKLQCTVTALLARWGWKMWHFKRCSKFLSHHYIMDVPCYICIITVLKSCIHSWTHIICMSWYEIRFWQKKNILHVTELCMLSTKLVISFQQSTQKMKRFIPHTAGIWALCIFCICRKTVNARRKKSVAYERGTQTNLFHNVEVAAPAIVWCYSYNKQNATPQQQAQFLAQHCSHQKDNSYSSAASTDCCVVS